MYYSGSSAVHIRPMIGTAPAPPSRGAKGTAKSRRGAATRSSSRRRSRPTAPMPGTKPQEARKLPKGHLGGQEEFEPDRSDHDDGYYSPEAYSRRHSPAWAPRDAREASPKRSDSKAPPPKAAPQQLAASAPGPAQAAPGATVEPLTPPWAAAASDTALAAFEHAALRRKAAQLNITSGEM